MSTQQSERSVLIAQLQGWRKTFADAEYIALDDEELHASARRVLDEVFGRAADALEERTAPVPDGPLDPQALEAAYKAVNEQMQKHARAIPKSWPMSDGAKVRCAVEAYLAASPPRHTTPTPKENHDE